MSLKPLYCLELNCGFIFALYIHTKHFSNELWQSLRRSKHKMQECFAHPIYVRLFHLEQLFLITCHWMNSLIEIDFAYPLSKHLRRCKNWHHKSTVCWTHDNIYV